MPIVAVHEYVSNGFALKTTIVTAIVRYAAITVATTAALGPRRFFETVARRRGPIPSRLRA